MYVCYVIFTVVLQWFSLVSCRFHSVNVDHTYGTSILKDKDTALNPIKPDTQSVECQKSLFDKIASKEIVLKPLTGKKRVNVLRGF